MAGISVRCDCTSTWADATVIGIGSSVPVSTTRRASVAFVLMTLGLNALGVGIIAPIIPGLVQQLAHLPPERVAPWVGGFLGEY